jgi:hypothetical protein
VKTQASIAVNVYILVAIVRERLNLDASLYTLLQIVSVALLEKMPVQQAFQGEIEQDISKRLNLFVG